jgi:cytochrome c oxidase cbb3-type subunit 3
MPAFAGKIAPEQIWQLAAYVRSMSGEAPKAARPGRDDHLRTPSPQEAKPKPPAADEREDY